MGHIEQFDTNELINELKKRQTEVEYLEYDAGKINITGTHAEFWEMHKSIDGPATIIVIKSGINEL
jgi:hypothetical protein